jgi:hypothetical protein
VDHGLQAVLSRGRDEGSYRFSGRSAFLRRLRDALDLVDALCDAPLNMLASIFRGQDYRAFRHAGDVYVFAAGSDCRESGGAEVGRAVGCLAQGRDPLDGPAGHVEPGGYAPRRESTQIVRTVKVDMGVDQRNLYACGDAGPRIATSPHARRGNHTCRTRLGDHELIGESPSPWSVTVEQLLRRR